MSEKYGEGKESWTPIGADYDHAFKGTFDGGDHTISNLYINSVEGNYAGLFGSSSGTIQNLELTDVSVNVKKNYVGGVCGYNDGGTIASCSVSGMIEAGADGYVGGIVGYSGSGSVSNCSNTCAVSGGAYTGGVVGLMAGTSQSKITNCYNTGAVTAKDAYAYAYAGGVVGYMYGGTVSDCYNTGAVTATGDLEAAGGVVGWMEQGTVSGCYYLAGTASNAGDGTELSAEEFKLEASFEGWDFTDTWVMSSILGRPLLISNTEPLFKGAGTEADPYQIPDLEKLEAFRDYVNSGKGEGEYFKLTDNIDMAEKYGAGKESWTPIGTYEIPFAGTFDGDNHTINGLYINGTNADYFGLFGSTRGTIQNLELTNVNITGTGTGDGSLYYVGGVCGYNNSTGKIMNCSVSGTTASASGLAYVGGIAGANSGTITKCYNTGAVSSHGYNGGICGEVDKNGIISDCYNTGEVSDGNYNGGIAGRNQGTVLNCYNTGAVSAATVGYGVYVDSLVGNNSGEITGCCYLAGTASSNYGTMLSAEQFKDTASFEGWDFGNTWEMSDMLERPVLVSNREAEPLFKGAGTEADPYQIPDLEKLEAFRDYVNEGEKYEGKYFKLTDNIDMSEKYGEGKESWTPIGTSFSILFAGTFDGDNHTINGLYIDANTCGNYTGLFGDNKGTIQNLKLTDAFLNGLDTKNEGACFAGGVCGYNQRGGTIENCSVSGTISSVDEQEDVVGGVAGRNAGEITNCRSSCSITGSSEEKGQDQFGGIAGDNSGTITKCYNTGAVSGSTTGGICGYAYNRDTDITKTISDCYNTGTVSGRQYAGGIVGMVNAERKNVNITISNCYNFGEVSGSGTKGGVVGYIASTGESAVITVEKCYYNSERFTGNAVGGQSAANGTITVDAAGKTGADYANRETFADWDFTDTWEMSAALGRPVLKSNPELPLLTITVTDGRIGSETSAAVAEGQSVTITPTDETIAVFVDGDGTWILPNEKGEFIYQVTKDTALKGVSLGVTLMNGAQVRIGGGVGTDGKVKADTKGSGLRFIAKVDKTDTLASMTNDEIGILIYPADATTITATTDFNEAINDVNVSKYILVINAEQMQDETTFTAALTNIKEGNYNRRFTAKPYVKIDGKYYTDSTSVTRSIYEVAAGLMTTEKQVSGGAIDVLNAYLNQVGIRLTIEGITGNGSVEICTKEGAETGAYTGVPFFEITAGEQGNEGVYAIELTAAGNATFTKFWNDYIRINNNHSTVIKGIDVVNAELSENGKTLTFTFNCNTLATTTENK